MQRLQLNSKLAAAVTACILATLVILICVIYGNKPIVEEDLDKYFVSYPNAAMNYGKQFNDLNPLHIEAAKAVGLSSTPEKRDDVDPKELVLVEDCKAYYVDKLDYSIPYLTKGAKKELDLIGELFRQKLKDNDLPKYRFMVTSVLRTKEDVKNLRKVNVNASANSAHCYGTTWDISYYTFEKVGKKKEWMSPEDLRKVLAEVLAEEQAAGRLYVKYEKRESCFHITARTK